MDIKLIGTQEVDYANEILESYYADDFIPPDKKSYLTHLKKSVGPYLAVESKNGECAYLMDAASQIATIGLGFTPQAFIGVVSNPFSLSDLQDSETGKMIVTAFKNFLQRKLQKKANFIFCHSGAEANEIALGQCFERFRGERKKILAFEGSFHGRMQVALMSTWNPAKRIPFEMPHFEKTEYLPFPEIDNDDFDQGNTTEWKKLWENCTQKNFKENIDQYSFTHKDQTSEIEILISVKEKLEGKDIFAVLIEPMQCEGGDKYASSAFYNALTILANVYDVPLIFDEVQTGFHLGRDFFWFKSFNITDSRGVELFPNYVTCAKKSQVGIVIDLKQNRYQRTQEYNLTSLYRGLIHGQLIDQRSEQIKKIENYTRNKLTSFVSKYSEHIGRPRVCGMSFAFEVFNKDYVAQFIAKRFDIGLLYYPAGEKTLRFRTNLSFKESDIDFLFSRLDMLADHLYHSVSLTPEQNVTIEHFSKENLFEWPKKFLDARQGKINEKDLLSFCEKVTQLKCVLIDRKLFDEIKPEIIKLEEEIYEEERRTELIHFQQSVDSENGICLGLFDEDNKIVAISFSAPLEIFPFENGLRTDRNFHDSQSIYMIDTTVRKESQGNHLGLHIKATLVALASLRGRNRIVGRTRDIFAFPMLSINMSLGAYETQYIKEDYKDFLKHRDVIIYEINLENRPTPVIHSALHNRIVDWDSDKLDKISPSMTNKICLSNFVSVHFLETLKKMTNEAPKELQHIYMASGQSECIDKIIKSMWFRSDKTRTNLMSIDGHHFGHGSFYSRSISGIDSVFDCTKVSPTSTLSEIEQEINKRQPLAFFISTFGKNLSSHLPLELIDNIVEVCKDKGVKVVINDTTGHCYKGSKDHYFTINDLKNKPDAFYVYLGGQSALCFLNENIFVKDPLMMISTWDGDESSLSRAYYEKEWIDNNKELFNKNIDEFDETIRQILSQHKGQYFVKRGVVLTENTFPIGLKHLLPQSTSTYFDTNFNSRSLFNEQLRKLI